MKYTRSYVNATEIFMCAWCVGETVLSDLVWKS